MTADTEEIIDLTDLIEEGVPSRISDSQAAYTREPELAEAEPLPREEAPAGVSSGGQEAYSEELSSAPLPEEPQEAQGHTFIDHALKLHGSRVMVRAGIDP